MSGVAFRQRPAAEAATNITGGAALEWRGEHGSPGPEPTAATREAEARALWRNAKTPELRAHLRRLSPDLFPDRVPVAFINPAPRKISRDPLAIAAEVAVAVSRADEARDQEQLAAEGLYLKEAWGELNKLAEDYNARLGMADQAAKEAPDDPAPFEVSLGLFQEAYRRGDLVAERCHILQARAALDERRADYKARFKAHFGEAATA